MTAGCFVRWPLAAPRDELAAVVRDATADADGTGVDAVLPGVGAQTVSLFVHRADDDPALAWFVEHDDRAAWRDPATAIREHSPLFDRGLADLLAADDPHVVAAAASTVELVHATLPGRPNGYRDRTDRLPVVLSADDPAVPAPDVVPLRLGVRGGLGSLFARAFAGVVRRTPAWLEATFEAWSEPILEAEGMTTETLLLERTPGGHVLWWYMEAGDMADVYEAYYETDRRVARVSERVLGAVLDRPGRVLRHPVEASEFDLLAHAVAADRE